MSQLVDADVVSVCCQAADAAAADAVVAMVMFVVDCEAASSWPYC